MPSLAVYEKLIALYACNPPRTLHMALLTPPELQIPPWCLLGILYTQ